MTNLSQPKRDEQLVQQAFLDAFPNPDRLGCPGDQVIRAIAQKKIQSDDAFRRHMRQCSNCTQELLTFRQNLQTVKRTRLIFLAAAATVLLAVGIYWRHTSYSPQSNVTAQSEQTTNAETATLDFYQSDIQRGTGDSAVGVLQKIRSSARVLIIILPMASNPGEYEVQIREGSDDGKTLKAFRAVASAQSDGRTTLRWDLGKPLPPGSFGAAFRLQGSSLWSYGTFTVQ